MSLTLNPASIASSSNVSSHSALYSANFTEGQMMTVSNYAVEGDFGGGTFVWAKNDTEWPDGGVRILPNDRTATVTDLTLATTDGVTNAWYGQLNGYSVGSCTYTTVSGKGTGAELSITAITPITASTTGTAASGATTLTVASATNIFAGQTVSGTGIASGTTVSSISGTTVILSTATTVAVANTVTFTSTTGPIKTVEIVNSGGGFVAPDIIILTQGNVTGAMAYISQVNGESANLTGTQLSIVQSMGNILPTELTVTAGSLSLTDKGYGQIVSNPLVATTTGSLNPGVTLSFQSGNTGSNVMVVDSVAGVEVGQIMTCVGVPPNVQGGETISYLPGGLTVTSISSSTTAASTNGTAASSSTSMTVDSATGIAVGQPVSGAGIASGTVVSAISGTTVTLSQATTAALSETPVTFEYSIYGQVGYQITLSDNIMMPLQGVTVNFIAPVTFNINYTTGIWSLVYTVPPAAGTTITSTYTYSVQPGRWQRQFDGNALDIRWYGANSNPTQSSSVNDMWPGWVRADYYASITGLSVRIPAPPRQIGYRWVLKTPMVVTAQHTYGDAQNGVSLNVNGLSFPYPDLGVAVTTTAANFILENILVSGLDNMPSSPADIISGGFIKTAAVFEGTMSGTTLTVTSMTSGFIAMGQSISGAGMVACPVGQCKIVAQTSGTPGGVGTYTFSMPNGITQSTISTAITITATWMPYYTAFYPGHVAFSALTLGQFINCQSSKSKIGYWLNASGGHTSLKNCATGGFFGVFNIGSDLQDYSFWDCDMTGCTFSGIAAGTSGIGASAWRCHLGFGPYGIFQFNDGLSGGSFGIELFGCSLEGFAEAAMYTIRVAEVFHYGWPGNNVYPNPFPTSFVPVPNAYLFQFMEQGLTGFTSSQRSLNHGGWAGSTTTVDLMFINQTGTTQPLDGVNNQDTFGYGLMDLDTLAGSVQYPAAGASVYDFRKPRYDRDYVRRTEELMLSDFAPQGNVFLNPEVVSNWTAENNSMITITPLATLLAEGGALNGWIVPRQIYEECGPNPNVIVITGTSSSAPRAQLAVNNLISINPARAIALSGWFATSGSSTSLFYLQNTSGATIAQPFSSGVSTGETFFRLPVLGPTLNDSGSTAIRDFTAAGYTDGASIYLIGMMLCMDDYAPYNPYAGPNALAPLSNANYALASLPAARNFALGATAFCTDGRNSGEAAGAGTGTPVFVKSVSGTAMWCAVWSGAAVTN